MDLFRSDRFARCDKSALASARTWIVVYFMVFWNAFQLACGAEPQPYRTVPYGKSLSRSGVASRQERGSSIPIKAIQLLLQDPQSKQREAAVFMASFNDRRELLEDDIRRRIRDMDENVKVAAIRALPIINPRGDLSFYTEILETKEHGIWIALIESLPLYVHSDVIDLVLARAFVRGDSSIKAKVLEQCGLCGSLPVITDLVLRGLSSEESVTISYSSDSAESIELRVFAARAAATLVRNRAVIDALTSSLSDANTMTDQQRIASQQYLLQAAVALSRISTDSLVSEQFLRNELMRIPSNNKDTVFYAIADAGTKLAGLEKVILIRVNGEVESVELLAALSALRQIGASSPLYLNMVSNWQEKHESCRVRIESAISLAECCPAKFDFKTGLSHICDCTGEYLEWIVHDEEVKKRLHYLTRLNSNDDQTIEVLLECYWAYPEREDVLQYLLKGSDRQRVRKALGKASAERREELLRLLE